MDNIENTKSIGFFNSVFDFGNDSKAEMSNIIQYSLMALIPIILLNKATQSLIPEVDESKSSLELGAEVAFQTIFMFLGLYIIHKIIIYVPTYSELKYSELNITNVILVALVIVLSLQTRLGEKANIIYERLWDYIDGKKPVNNKKAVPQQQILQSQHLPHQQQIEQNLAQIIPNSHQQGIQNQQMNQPMNQPVNQPINQGFMAANEALGGSFGSAF
tara:strand:- start:2593 stop:3243 length:651 start_codon:yes stop_codon:yes gene_type:complete